MLDSQKSLSLLVQHPTTGQCIDVAPLFSYLFDHAASSVPDPDGAASVCANLRAACRYVATMPIDVSRYSPEQVSNIAEDLFTLEELFATMSQQTVTK